MDETNVTYSENQEMWLWLFEKVVIHSACELVLFWVKFGVNMQYYILPRIVYTNFHLKSNQMMIKTAMRSAVTGHGIEALFSHNPKISDFRVRDHNPRTFIYYI